MPELPEVETIKNAVERAVCGSRILNVEVRCRRFRQEIPADFEKLVSGTRIVSLRRVAKYIIIALDNGQNIIWHLGMSGRIKITDFRPSELAKHDHVIFETSQGCIIFNDARRFGMLTCCAADSLEEHPLLRKAGIDPFHQDLDGDYLQRKLKNKKIAVKLALLDQTIISGIGNIYASEALYMARVNPQRPADSLSLSECSVLVDSIRKVLRQAIEAGGSTLKDYRKPDGSMGYFQNVHCVYNKTGQRCPDCTCDLHKTGGIRKIVQGGRSTFYCETLQK